MKNALRKVGRALGKLATYVAATAFALLLLAILAVLSVTQTKSGLTRGAALLSDTLNTQLNGHFEASFAEASIGFGGIEGVSAKIRRREGGPVLVQAEGLRVRWSALRILRSLSAPTLDIELPSVNIERAHLDVTDVDALAETFSVRNPSVGEAQNTEPSVALRITHASIEHITTLVPGPQGPMPVEAHAVEGAVLVDSDVAIDVTLPDVSTSTHISRQAEPIRASGGASAALAMDALGELVLVAQYTGQVGDAYADVNAALIDEDWTATIGIHAEPDAVAALGLGWRPGGALNVSVDAVGDMEMVSTVAVVRGEHSDVVAAADTRFEPLTVRGVINALRLDPSELYEGAEPGRITFDSGIEYTAKELAVSLQLQASNYGRMNIPRAQIELEAQELERYQLNVLVDDESRANLRADVALGNRVTARAVLSSRKLPDALSTELEDRVVIDDVHATLDAVTDREFSLQSLRGDLHARRVSVPAASLRVDDLAARFALDDGLRVERIVANIQASTVALGSMKLSKLEADVEPSTNGNRLKAATMLELEAGAPARAVTLDVDVQATQPLDLRHIRATVEAKHESIELAAQRVHQTSAGFQIERAAMSGAGQLTLDALIGDNVKLSSTLDRLDLERLSRMARPLVPALRGYVTGRSELLLGPVGDVRGFIDLVGKDLGYGGVQAVDVDVQLRSDGTTLNGVLALNHGATQIKFDGRDISVASVNRILAEPRNANLEQVVGTFKLAASTNGPELAQLLEQPNLKQDMTLDALVDFEHQPGVPIRFATKTAVLLRRHKSEAQRASATEDARLDWESEFRQASSVWHNRVRLTATNISTLHAEASLSAPLTTLRLAELGDALSKAPIDGDLTLDKFDLALLPRDLPLPGLEGTLEAQGELGGTLSSPRGHLDLMVEELQVQSIEQSLAVTLRVNADYADDSLLAAFGVTHDGSKVASGRVDGTWATNHWTIDARLDDISLGCLPYVRDYGVEGHLTGYAKLDLSEEPKISTYLLGRGFRLNASDVPYWSLQGNLEGGQGKAVMTLMEPSGFARVAVEASDVGSDFATVGPWKLTAAMKNFELRPLLGVATGVVRDGAGVVNGNLEAEFVNGNIAASGNLVLRNGSLLVPVLGREFTDLRATVRADPGKLTVEGFQGRFGPGRFEGDGRLAYDQEANLKAELDLHIPANDPVPLSREGRDVAHMSGRIEVAAKSDSSGMTTEIVLSKLDVFVSEETEQVLSLAPPEYTTIGYRGVDGEFTTYGSQEAKPEAEPEADPMTLKLKLGRDVWVHRGQGTFAALEGGITLRLGNDVRSEGALVIPEGRIDVMGRVFEVHPSSVTFGGEDIDPDVVAEASWLSPSGHTVIASFRGPVSSGKMQLRSEPALSYGEILNVLLFDDPTGAPDSGASPTATSVAGTIIGAGLGRTLSDLTNLDLQANVEQTESGSTRPEIGIRLSPRLALQVSYNPQPVVSLTEPPDQAQVSLDWRVSKGWSLESKLGNQGSASADLRWQYRY